MTTLSIQEMKEEFTKQINRTIERLTELKATEPHSMTGVAFLYGTAQGQISTAHLLHLITLREYAEYTTQIDIIMFEETKGE